MIFIHPQPFAFMPGTGEKISGITENFWMLTNVSALLEA